MALIIIGSVLIVLQLMSLIGTLYAGNWSYFSNVTDFATFIYDLIGFTAYNFIGIAGVVLLIIGICLYRKKKNGNKDEETTTSKDNEMEETIPSNDENMEEMPMEQEDSPLVENTEQENKTPSKCFCSKCGSIIDPTEKKCTGCGKQYFKGVKYYISVIFTKKRILPIVLSGMLIISVICNIALSSTVNRYSDMVVEKNNIIDGQSKTISNLIDSGFEDWKLLQFYEKYVVVVSNDGTNLYHKYGCEDFDDSYFWAYNVEKAEQLGYVAHKACCK